MHTEVYNDEFVYCGYENRNSCDTLLITFAPMNGAGSGQKIWGQGLNNSTFNILGLVAKNRSWYPEKSIRKISEKCKDIVSKYKHIICYGTSAGGYASIKYSYFFNSTAVISFSPIYSISSEDIDTEIDHRFFKFYKKGVTGGSKILPEEIQCLIFMVYDPYYQLDKYNAHNILNLSKKIQPIKCTFTGHFPILTINSSKKIDVIIKKIKENNLKELKELIYHNRVDSAIRIKGLIEYICLKKIAWADIALKILKNNLQKLNNNDKACLFAVIGRVYKSKNRNIDAQMCFETSIAYKPNDSLYLRELSSMYLKNGAIDLSEIYIFRSLSFNLNCCHAWNTYTSILLEKRNYMAAFEAVKRAIEIYPHRDFYKRLCSISERLGLYQDLLNTTNNALTLFKDIEFYRYHLISCHMLNDKENERKQLIKALSLYPDDQFLIKHQKKVVENQDIY